LGKPLHLAPDSVRKQNRPPPADQGAAAYRRSPPAVCPSPTTNSSLLIALPRLSHQQPYPIMNQIFEPNIRIMPPRISQALRSQLLVKLLTIEPHRLIHHLQACGPRQPARLRERQPVQVSPVRPHRVRVLGRPVLPNVPIHVGIRESHVTPREIQRTQRMPPPPA